MSDLTEVENEMTWSCQISTYELSFAEIEKIQGSVMFSEKHVIYFEYQSLKYIMNFIFFVDRLHNNNNYTHN